MNLPARRLVATLVLATAAATGVTAVLHAQTGRAVTPAETLQAADEAAEARETTPAGGTGPVTAGPVTVSEMGLMQAKIQALEARVARIEEALRRARPTAVAGDQAVAPQPGASEEANALKEAGVPLGQRPATEAELQEAEETRRSDRARQAETREGFNDMLDEQQRETQEEIRNRIRNAELVD